MEYDYNLMLNNLLESHGVACNCRLCSAALKYAKAAKHFRTLYATYDDKGKTPLQEYVEPRRHEFSIKDRKCIRCGIHDTKARGITCDD